MKIVRNFGQGDVEIELTATELLNAYDEQDKKYRMEDVDIFFDNNPEQFLELDEVAKATIADNAHSIIQDSAPYFDVYWECFEAAIREYREDVYKNSFIIRIFKEEYGFDNYDDTIYRSYDCDVDPNTVLHEVRVNSVEELISQWKDLLAKFEGYTYCVRSVAKNRLVVGGVMDPNDIEDIENWISNS